MRPPERTASCASDLAGVPTALVSSSFWDSSTMSQARSLSGSKLASALASAPEFASAWAPALADPAHPAMTVVAERAIKQEKTETAECRKQTLKAMTEEIVSSFGVLRQVS